MGSIHSEWMSRLLLVLILVLVAFASFRVGASSRAETQGTQPAPTGAYERPGPTIPSTESRPTQRQSSTTRLVLPGTDPTTAIAPPGGSGTALRRTESARRLERVFAMYHDGKGISAQQVSIVPSGSHLAVRYSDGTILVWQLDPVKLVWRLKAPPSTYDAESAVALSPDGRLLAFDVDEYWVDQEVHDVHQVEVWDVGSKRRIRRLKAVDGTDVLKFSQDGRRLLAAGTSMGYYDLRTWRFSGVFINSGQPPDVHGTSLPTGVALGSDGHTVVVSSSDYFAIWKPGQKKSRFVSVGDPGPSSLSADGSTVAFTTAGPAVSLWDVRSGRELRNWRVANTSTSILQLNDRGLLLVGGSTARNYQPTIEAFRLPAGTPAGRHTLPRELTGEAEVLGYDPRGYVFLELAKRAGNRIVVHVYELA
jgi:WD40 repeat protein